MFHISRIMYNSSSWLVGNEKKSSGYKPFIISIILFILSRGLYYAGGIRFDAFEGEHLLHFISPELLKNNLFQSVLYLHIQPPLFNVFIGLIYKLFPHNTLPAFHFIYFLTGLTLTFSLYLIMTRLGISTRLSALITIVFMVSPACLLFENLLLYTYPVAMFLCLAALFLHRFLHSSRVIDGILFFTFLSLIVLTRSFFHYFWFILIAVALLFFLRKKWKHIVLLSCIPLLAVTIAYGKNAYLFGNFSSSSWLGMSLSKLTTFKLSENERISLIKEGKLSELSLLAPFKSLWYYRQYIDTPAFQKTSIPVIDLEFFPDEGNNWNNMAFFSISKQYLKDAVFVLKSYPGVYIKSVLSSFRIFFFPSSDWFHFFPSVDNITKISFIETIYNSVFYGQFMNLSDPEEKRDNYDSYFANPLNIGIFLVLFYFVALLYGIHLIIKAIKKKPFNMPFTVTILFMLFTIVYVSVVSNALEIGENERFRFNIDPFIVIITGLLLQNSLIRIVHKDK